MAVLKAAPIGSTVTLVISRQEDHPQFQVPRQLVSAAPFPHRARFDVCAESTTRQPVPPQWLVGRATRTPHSRHATLSCLGSRELKKSGRREFRVSITTLSEHMPLAPRRRAKRPHSLLVDSALIEVVASCRAEAPAPSFSALAIDLIDSID